MRASGRVSSFCTLGTVRGALDRLAVAGLTELLAADLAGRTSRTFEADGETRMHSEGEERGRVSDREGIREVLC